uniref:ODV-E66 n=1 Tax=Parastrongyloides trichosuri TaxID=131310 RepID=A0A0N4Z058_PARTI
MDINEITFEKALTKENFQRLAVLAKKCDNTFEDAFNKTVKSILDYINTKNNDKIYTFSKMLNQLENDITDILLSPIKFDVRRKIIGTLLCINNYLEKNNQPLYSVKCPRFAQMIYNSFIFDNFGFMDNHDVPEVYDYEVIDFRHRTKELYENSCNKFTHYLEYDERCLYEATNCLSKLIRFSMNKISFYTTNASTMKNLGSPDIYQEMELISLIFKAINGYQNTCDEYTDYVRDIICYTFIYITHCYLYGLRSPIIYSVLEKQQFDILVADGIIPAATFCIALSSRISDKHAIVCF